MFRLLLHRRAERRQERIDGAGRIHLGVDEVVLDRLPGREIGEIVLDLHLQMVERGREPGLGGRLGFVFLPEIVDLLAGGGIEGGADLLDGLLLARGLELLALAGLEERHVADLGLDQVVHEDHLQRLLDVDGLLEMAVHQQRHERHLPAMLGDALLPAARQPAVPQLELEPLGEGEEVEDAFDLIHLVLRDRC